MSPLLPLESEETELDTKEAHNAAVDRHELVAEGNIVSACSIFSASVVLDALNALPSTLVVDVPVSLRTTALVLIALVAAPPVQPHFLFQQRGLACCLLVGTAWVGLHQGGVNARIADAMYTLLCGWAVLLIFGLTGPGVGEKGHDAKGRRENVIALSAGFLGYSGVRIVRAGIFHASEVAQFTSTHGDISTRGFAMADDLVASTLVFGGTLCVCAAFIILINHESIYMDGCTPVCRVMAHLSVLVFTAAFVIQVVSYANIDELGALFGDAACTGGVEVCEASYRARRLYTSNSSAASLWCCAVGLTVFAFPYERRCRSRRAYFSHEEEDEEREAAAGSGYVALLSAAIAIVTIYFHGDETHWMPSIELLLLYGSIPVAWFGSTFIACALHTIGIATYAVGRLGSVVGFDLTYLTHWFVAATLLVVASLTVTTFVSWMLYSSPCSRGRYIIWLDNLTALLVVALVSMQLFLVIASLGIGSGYDGGLVADTTSWRTAALQWCTQHSISFFFSAALVGGRFETHNDGLSRLALRIAWFSFPLVLAACWVVTIIVGSAVVPYGAVGDTTSISIAFLAAAAPWTITGWVVC